MHENGQLTQTQLKDRLNIEAPPLSRTVARLEELGYIEKYVSEDKRTNNIKLSEEGEANYPKWQALIQTAENSLLQELGEKRKTELDDHVLTLSAVIRKIKGGDK
ncbi:MarR family winged helix-turn-helix transcriptional regulator [Halobacillus sp. Marseille-P3879]|uniref:MarR family winged helix-turn-helix transcriptional regulator n=1 Tax=Halobacillus sp. Marseille-P3879 TaxID=2045014 RepID=UPI0021012CC1|nr:MarR family transcriptional regulator [Halobacillus sp. Marseille-P3879]